MRAYPGCFQQSLAGLAVLCAASAAHALQPLDTFMQSALLHNVDILDAQTNRAQQNAQKNLALGHVLPSLALKATYTHNEYHVTFPFNEGPGTKPINLVVQPGEQWDGFITLSVPLLNMANFALISAAEESEDAVRNQAAYTRLEVCRQVTQNYYQLVANMALVEASQKALNVARAGSQLTEDLYAAGRSATLEVNRAQAEVQRQLQQLASAELQMHIIAQTLTSITAEIADLHDAPLLDDALLPEEPMATFETPDEQLPALAAAIGMRKVRERQAHAQRLNWVPALSASFNERLTNVTGFNAGHWLFYNVGVTLNWNVDLTTFASIDAANATAATARIQETRTRLAMRDNIFVGWQTVRANIARSRAAREQQKVSTEAATLAKDRYTAGVATQLDLLQAQRDAFSADVSRIQADADLVNARTQLRLYANKLVHAAKREAS